MKGRIAGSFRSVGSSLIVLPIRIKGESVSVLKGHIAEVRFKAVLLIRLRSVKTLVTFISNLIPSDN